jgi:exonuclease III
MSVVYKHKFKSVVYKHNFKFGCWNINGLSKDKCHDPALIEYVTKHDCAIFVESWINIACLNVPGYYTYSKAAIKGKYGRAKGGIVIMLKESIRKGVKILQNNDDFVVWLKFEKLFFAMEKDMYVGAIYVAPITSGSDRSDKYEIWENLEELVFKYNELGNVMLLGDFNSRTGVNNETLEYNTYIDDELPVDSSLTQRNSKDNKTNEFGKKLLDLCRHNNLIILNGRVIGDMLGQYTSFHYNGSSAIDYCIVTRDLFSNILYFSVLELNHLSDHTPISVCINKLTLPNSKSKDGKVLPNGFVWEEKGYIDILKLTQFTQRIKTVYVMDNMNVTAMG